MRRAVMCAMGIVMVCGIGCATRKSSLLLERRGRGPLNESSTIGQGGEWRLTPQVQTLTKSEVEVYVNHTSREYQKNFFSDRKVFKEYAGTTPYFPEFLVFYVKITNRSDKKIRLNPAEFVMTDDHGNQYSAVGVDYVTAFAEYRAPVSTTTRGVLEGASPGYFGVSFPVGKFIAQKPQGRYALLQQSALQPGHLYPGVVYDGLIAFWTPATDAKTLRLLLTNINTDFDANDIPKTTLEFPFEFSATK